MALTKFLSSFPLARSSYYYQSRPGQRGRAISQQTLTRTGLIITNEQVVEWIRDRAAGAVVSTSLHLLWL